MSVWTADTKELQRSERHLTTYQMSRVHLHIILHVNEIDFTKICIYIENQELVGCLKELYFGKLQPFYRQ